MTVQAGDTKNKEKAVKALLPDIAAELRAWLPTRPEAGPVFRILERAFAMVCADLEAAGIPRQTEEGVLHFHALRHTYITMAARAPGADVMTL